MDCPVADCLLWREKNRIFKKCIKGELSGESGTSNHLAWIFMAGKRRLKKELGLFDVFSISTGAMFSSGFFLLPGLASQFTGPSVFLAYLFAGFLIIPSMLSIAEIATALPRSGGAYFILDRSLGPLMGTIGGIGTYLSLVFKTAFALVGIGAYAAIFWDVPVKTIALSATFFFMIINLIGAKKTSGLQNIFVIFLIVVLGAFIFDGMANTFFTEHVASPGANDHFSPFFTGGVEGFLVTTGFVFVSYLGLTQIASVAEEIKNPERNIPLGMLLSLIVTGTIYFLGVFVMVSIIEPTEFSTDLAPTATAVKSLFHWLPDNIKLYLMVGAAMAAFASTGNAGMLASSRYPMAMGRDKLLPQVLAKVGKKGTPVYAIVLTATLIALFICVLSEEGIAKMASTFMLVIFFLINFSVIVFRSSNIQSYDPGFRTPFYPVIQVAGMIISVVLISFMGWLSVIFSAVVVVVSVIWFHYYAKSKVKREGAIFHWFALLGKYQYAELENEFMTILKEKGLRQGDPFDETIINARITMLDKKIDFLDLVDEVSGIFSTEMHVGKDVMVKEFLSVSTFDPSLVVPEVAILFARHEGIDRPSLHIILSDEGVQKSVHKSGIHSEDHIRVFFFLVSPAKESRMQLRMLSRLIDIMERDGFVGEILSKKNQREIKEYLLHNERFITVRLLPGTVQASMIGKQLKEVRFPPDVLVALIERNSETYAPNGNTVLQANDVLTIIGEPPSITYLFNMYMKGI